MLRESGYYDNNIIPLVALLNLVAISTLFLEPIDFFQRALLTLNIAFAEIGIRMTTDSHLPNVSYQSRLQKMLNEFFCGLLLLVLEGNLVYELHRGGSNIQSMSMRVQPLLRWGTMPTGSSTITWKLTMQRRSCTAIPKMRNTTSGSMESNEREAD